MDPAECGQTVDLQGEIRGLSTQSPAAKPSRTPACRYACAGTAEILNTYVRSCRYCNSSEIAMKAKARISIFEWDMVPSPGE
jgi:hypothetical protein